MNRESADDTELEAQIQVQVLSHTLAMKITDRTIISTVIAICCMMALAGAVWLPWWVLPFFGAALVWIAPMLAALISQLDSRP
ncbi:MAG: hypothetical protein P3W87_007400 [Gammaproteobacteria bacterium]|nr:hypothetical protein [Gammaproteobacteria bacterium]